MKDFAHRLALVLAQSEPDRFTAALAKAKRTGRIFIDYLRNQRGATAVMPYSARAREGAPVAVPITWEELAKLDRVSGWHIGDAGALLKRAASRIWSVGDALTKFCPTYERLSSPGAPMKIATYNVNGINGRLPVLLRWLDEAQPDVVCLQELKAPDEKFPLSAIEAAGYGAIWQDQKSWNGVAILARGAEPVETRRGLPGDPDDVQSRYLEAAVGGILIAGFYLPNGNPRPGRNSITSSPGWSA